MRARGTSGLLVVAVLLSVSLLPLTLSAQEGRRAGGLFGDWRVKMDFNGRAFESILAFSRDDQGQRTGEWINFFGVSPLKEITFEDGKLSFSYTRQNRDGNSVTSKFTGTIREGKLTGTLSSERGDTSVEGQRDRRVPRIAGNWETKFTIGDREITNNLVIGANQEGKLTVDWQSQRVEHKISDINFEGGKLTFKAKSKMDDREWESTFDGSFEGNAYSAVLKSEAGERTLKGQRIGAPLIGTWNLDVSSEFGDRKQRLRVFPDMSALYGSMAIDKIQFNDGKVSFKTSLEFGDQPFEMNFQGKVEGDRLTGEMTTARGTQKIAGTRSPQRRGGRGQRTSL